MTAHITDAILSLRPNAIFTIANEDLTKLVWLDQVQVRPTDAEITTEATRIASVGMVPSVITDRQFFQQLVTLNIISESEALAAVKTGTIPSALQTLVNSLPSAQQFPATMLISGEVMFKRSHPLTNTIGAAYGMSPTQMDQFFQAAALL